MKVRTLLKIAPATARLLSAASHKIAIIGMLAASISAASATSFTAITVGSVNGNNQPLTEATDSTVISTDFITDMGAAFTNETGGVWNFDGAGWGLANAESVTLTYGTSQTNSLVLAYSEVGGGGINQGNFGTGQATSGSFGLGEGGSTVDRTFTPSKPLLELGIISVNRGDASRIPSLVVTFMDGTTATTSGANMGAWFFHGFKTNTANPIVKFTLHQEGNLCRYDDLGFVPSTANYAPTFTTQPASQNLYTGDTLQLSASVAGANLVYQWKSGAPGGGTYTNVPGATSVSLTVPNVTASLDYVLYVTNTSGSVTSAVAAVTVNEPTYVDGLFNSGFELPNTGKINSGFDVPGNDVPGWKNAGPNQNDTGIEAAGSGRAGGTTYAAYLHRGQSGAFQIGTNVITQAGQTVSLTWWARDSYQGVNAKVSILSAASQTAAFGSTTELAAQTNEVTGGWTQYALSYNTVAGDVGKLVGVAFQSADPATATGWANFDDFALIVLPPTAAPQIINQPTSRTGYLGGTTTFTVNAAGSGLSYQWQAGEVGSGIYTNISNGGHFSGATTASLTISNIAVENGLDYVVVVSNTGGSLSTAPATLTVDTSVPLITAQPVSATRFTGESVTFTNQTTGAVTYQWQAGAVGSGIYTNLSNGGQFAGVNTSILTITNLLKANQADYVVVVSNGAGPVTSDPATLTIIPVIYFHNFETSNTNLNTIGWAADSQSGNEVINNNPSAGGRCIFDANSQNSVPEAFYTSAVFNNAFPVIKLADMSAMSFSVDLQSWWHPESIHSYFAVQINWSKWYVSTTELPQPTGTQTTLPMTFDPSAGAWNELTVSGTGGLNTSLPIVGTGATNDLTGYMTGAGVVTVHDTNADGSSWESIDNFKIVGDGFTVLPGLGIAPSGSNVIVTWGYGTLLESTSVTGPWTPASGTSPKTVSPASGTKFYRLQLP